jgi:hypothetical protein
MNDGTKIKYAGTPPIRVGSKSPAGKVMNEKKAHPNERFYMQNSLTRV